MQGEVNCFHIRACSSCIVPGVTSLWCKNKFIYGHVSHVPFVNTGYSTPCTLSQIVAECRSGSGDPVWGGKGKFSSLSNHLLFRLCQIREEEGPESLRGGTMQAHVETLRVAQSTHALLGLTLQLINSNHSSILSRLSMNVAKAPAVVPFNLPKMFSSPL